MKKMVSLIIIVILLCATSAIAETYMDSFLIRNGISFGMTMDEVEKLETETLTSKPTYTSELVYQNIQASGISSSQLNYIFDANGKLYRIAYFFGSENKARSVCKNDYSKIRNGLIEKYGAPLGYANGNSHTVKTTTLEFHLSLLSITQMLKANVSYAYDPYNEWVIKTDDGYVKIEHVMSCHTAVNGSSCYHQLSYQFYSNEEWGKLIGTVADDI